MAKKIVAIWAEDEAGLIGANGELPWRLPAELEQFKAVTMGNAILMGRVTFDGMKRRILPGRETLILTRDKAFQVPGVTVFSTREAVLEWFSKQDKDLYILGGAEVFKVFDGTYDELVKTVVHGTFEGDTYFPDIDLRTYKEIDRRPYKKDANNSHDFTVIRLRKG